jgi:hypothetical protein
MAKLIVMKFRGTREEARAVAHRAGMDSMARGGRSAWSVEDYNAAVAKFNELWPQAKIEEELENVASMGRGTESGS